jgi:hypothetical protein
MDKWMDGEARILHGIWSFRRNFPEFHNLITVFQTVNNICTVLFVLRVVLRTLKSPYIQSVMLTFPLHHRGTPIPPDRYLKNTRKDPILWKNHWSKLFLNFNFFYKMSIFIFSISKLGLDIIKLIKKGPTFLLS